MMQDTNTASGAAMQLADQYAAAHAKWALEDLYGTSKSYTAKMLKERHALRSHLAAALASAAAPAEQPSMSNVTHDWRDSPSYGGEICANCGAVNGTRRSKLACGQKTETPQRRWPFAETPGEFTERLREAMQGSGDLLAAVRHVLIERPALVVPHTPLAAATAPQPDTAYAALPMESAPKDGTMLRLQVMFEDGALEDDNSKPIWTIGFNNLGNTGEDEWQFAGWNWSHDCFSVGTGTPVGWLPMLDASSATRGQAPAGGAVAGPGWKWVPMVPTDAMSEAGSIAGNGHDWSGPDPVYVAMLAAAPPAQAADSVLEDAALSQAARDVLAERQRQISTEGWTPEHDDEHVNYEIAAMACYYVMPPGAREWSGPDGYGATLGEAIRPEGWDAKDCDRRRELVKGAALALAELERIDRAAMAAKKGEAT